VLCALFSLTHARASLEQLVQLEQFDLDATAQQFHTLGNHCISRLSRTFVCEKLAIPTTTSTRPPSASLFTRLMRGCSSTPSTTDLPPTAYYSHDLSPRWVLIVLDTTELSGHANHPPDSEPARESAAYLAANPLSEKNPHMIPWNGGITKRQMAWLKAEIRRAERRGKLVLVACHHPIHPDSARKSHLAWNYREILKVLRKSSNVRLVLSGHDHLGGGCRVTARRGKTEQVYVTVPAILEAGEHENEYLVVDVDELERLTGGGKGNRTAVAADAAGFFIGWGGPKSERIARQVF
jgi:hypothetical protein